jgi:membrane-associated protease RseP (regulator of RpoE activity)
MKFFNNTMGEDLFLDIREIVRDPSQWVSGLPFSITIMSILLAHEMGHYLTCVYYGIDATLPYFIPAPTPMGSMGAFIRIRSPFPDRGSLLDVGIAGPIAGFVLAIPALTIGLGLSRFVAAGSRFLNFGEPIVFRLLSIVMGKVPPAGMELNWHPIAIAGWFGLLATALNLLPAGQLDGGHVTYALFPASHKRISQILVVVLTPLGIWFWHGWLVWVVLLLIIRLGHPMTINNYAPLKRRHLHLGWLGLVILILCFMPSPLIIPD